MSVDFEKLKEQVGARKDFEGCSIEINHSTCRLGECQLCLLNCPTNALYQQNRVEIIHELCVGCGSCVLLCMVPGCIKLTRTRSKTGKIEVLTTPKEVIKSIGAENSKKRRKLVLKELRPDRREDDYSLLEF
ncbi:MAG: hypothetical protein ACXAEU_02930 [Candidatus Hodarchaeales archaeon]